jgi:hypothetical protein
MSRLGQFRLHAVVDASRRSRDLAGISAGTLVSTVDGELPVEYLLPGDRIITRSGVREVRRITSHVVRSSFRIRPRTLGLDRPEGEIVVGSAQQLHVRDWRARAFCNAAHATIPVGRLADGEYIVPDDRPVRLWRLEFEREEVIFAGGLEVTIPAPETVDI